MGRSLYLVDGHAQFHRAYHAIRGPMHSPITGEPTNLVFGFTSMLLKVLRDQRPDYLVVVIDASGDRGTFRSQLYPAYKAHRPPPPEDFPPQVERCRELLGALAIPVVAVEGVEADDAIASLVGRLRREAPDLDIRIVSRDKDLTQLLDERTTLFDPQSDGPVTIEKLFGRADLAPSQVPDALALMGDAVDNVPGVKGVGPKTAAELIVRFGSLAGVLAHLDEISGRRGEAIREAAASLPLSRRLVELRRDLAIDLSLESARADPRQADRAKVAEIMRLLGFGRLRDEMNALVGGAPPAPTAKVDASEPPPARRAKVEPGGLFDEVAPPTAAPIADVPTSVVREADELARLVEEVRRAIAAGTPISIDLETTSVVARSTSLCGISLSLDGREGFYVPVRSPEASSHLDEPAVLAALRPVLEDPAAVLLGHNLKFDLVVLRSHGVEPRGTLADTMIECDLAGPGEAGKRLKDVAERWLGVRGVRLEDLIGHGPSQRSFAEVPLAIAAPYAAQDAVLARRLHDRLLPELRAAGLEALCRDVEFPLVGVLAEMEHRGILVDPEELDRQRVAMEADLDRLRRAINDASPTPFSPDSPKQLAAVFFSRRDAEPPGLGLRPIRRGRTGPSTDSETLERLAADPEVDSPLPGLILEYRGLAKLVSTYLVALKQAINPATGRIHASFHQAATATGRLSSSEPNLQNIPIRTARGREIRKAFRAERGFLLLAADYSQIELRMLAHLSEDPGLLEAFRADRDIHVAVAAEVFGVAPEAVTSDMRSVAKMVNFGIVYGITAPGLARRLGGGTSRERAAQIIATYKARFAGIEAFLDRCVQTAREEGHVATILGRRRAMPQIASRNPAERAFGERAAINTVVQGSSADLIKVAMVRLDRRLREACPSARILLQIHDELVLEVPREEVERARSILVDSMEHAMDLRVPLRVETAASEDWFGAS